LSDTLTHLINGEAVTAGTHAGESVNPSNLDDVVARYTKAGAAEVNDAVKAARAAFPGWSQASPEVRSDVLDKASNIIMSRAKELGTLLSREEGKTLPEGTGEVMRAARILKYFAGEALRRHGQTLDSTRPNIDVETHREAVGVFGLITPWNFPIAIPAWKSAPALAFGNTVVLKPATPTPAIAHALGEILLEAGAPPGVFNLVIGEGDVGRAIVAHPDIDGISFTGSQVVGASVAEGAIKRQARVQLEMGGKNPLVVLDDADLDRAVMCAIDGAFYGTGQRCTASSRIIVTEGIHDRFVEALAEKARSLRVGDALDPNTQIGPAVSEAQLEQNLSYVKIARDEGGKVLTGGEPLTLDKRGYYMAPTVIADTAPDQRINCEEVFGPVASTVKVKDYEEALESANRGQFGLSAGGVANTPPHTRPPRPPLRAGVVMINLPTAGGDYHVPFGGSRKSSYGAREQGVAAVEFYTQTKAGF